MSCVQSSVIPTTICDNCFKPEAPFKCARCKLINYCTKACQTAAWKTHKLICAEQGSAIDVYTKVDAQGFSKVHYAALFQRPESIPVELHDLFEKALSKHGCTPNQLAALTAEPPQTTSVYLEGGDQPLTQNQYRELTGNYFHPDIYMLPEEVIEFYQQPFNIEDCDDCLSSKNEQERAVIERYKVHQPQLVIAPEPPMNRGLKTLTDIDEEEIICRFGGQTTRHPTKNHLGNLENIELAGTCYHLDQTRYSGAGRFSNEGPPNARVVVIKEENLPPSCCLRANRPIKAGEFIYWEYGCTHYLKFKKYYLSPANENTLNQFCRTKLRTPNDYFNITQETEGAIGHDYFMFQYLLHTPTVFFALHLNGALNPKTSLIFFKNPKINQKLESLTMSIHPTGRIDALEKFAQIQDNPPLCQAIYAMRSINGLAFVLFCMITLESDMTPSDISHYVTIANLFDQFYNYVNLDLQDRDEEIEGEQKGEKEKFDFLPIIEKYAQMPESMRKKEFLEDLLDYLSINGEGRTTKMDEIIALKNHISTLSLVTPKQINR